MSAHERVTAVIVHYKTPDLLRTAAGSLLRRCPGIPLLVVDNGSGPEGRNAIDEIREGAPDRVRTILNETNLHHGPAMDQALRALDTPFILFLDSDCEVLNGDIASEMLALLETDPNAYAAGERIFMDRRGFDTTQDAPEAVPYIRPVCMLVRRELYLTLPTFELHGTPCLANMTEAHARGYGLVPYPLGGRVSHKGRGTAARHGYGLGLRGKWNHLLHKLGL
jgi:glycosyltransferase involved in cell wall biosynthesis